MRYPHRNSVESSKLASSLNPAVPYEGTKEAGLRKVAEAAETDLAISMAVASIFIFASRSFEALFFSLSDDSEAAAAAAVRAQHIQ